MSDEDLYSVIANELSTEKTDAGLWTRAFAEANGDKEKTKAIYIRLRLLSLKKVAAKPPISLVNVQETGIEAESKARKGEVGSIRNELSKKLLERRATSFYSVFGLTPNAIDSVLTAAISDFDSRIADGTAQTSPEYKYAKEALGNPDAREAYDRRLLAQLSVDRNAMRGSTDNASYESETENMFQYWWGSRKTSVIVGVLSAVVIGYMMMGFSKDRGERELKKNELAIQREAQKAASDSESGRVTNERVAIDGGIAVTNKVADNARALGDRSLGISERAEDRRRQELEYRANAGSQILDMERERQQRQLALQDQRMEMEKKRQVERDAERHNRYWVCMNQALDKMKNADAEVRCASYR